MSIFDAPKIDCHLHVFDPDGFPYQTGTPYRPAGPEIATATQMAHVFAAYGVRNALLVQPNSGYGDDNRCLLAAIAGGAGRFKGIAVVPHGIGLAALAALKAQGIVGVAFNPALYGVPYYLGTAALLAKLEALDMLLQIQVQEDQLCALLPLLEGSAVRLLVDHCGRPAPGLGLAQPAFRALLALGRSGRATVKLSGMMKFAQTPYPFEDTWPFIRALAEAFTLERCLWGSDWPFIRASARVDYGPLLMLVPHLFPEPGDRQRIFWDTPRRLFGFRD